MNLKSFFDLEKVVFSKEELEEPYEDKSNDVIFIREDNSYEKTLLVPSPIETTYKNSRKKKKNNEL